MSIIQHIPAVVMLIYGSISDIKKGEVDIRIFAICAASGVAISVTGRTFDIKNIFGILPGGIILAIAKLSHEALGYGDGALIACMGILLGIGTVLAVTVLAVMLIVPITGILLISRKITFKDRLPWIPIIALSYVGVMFL